MRRRILRAFVARGHDLVYCCGKGHAEYTGERGELVRTPQKHPAMQFQGMESAAWGDWGVRLNRKPSPNRAPPRTTFGPR